jgi:hypothetical protein
MSQNPNLNEPVEGVKVPLSEEQKQLLKLAIERILTKRVRYPISREDFKRYVNKSLPRHAERSAETASRSSTALQQVTRYTTPR